MSTITGWVRYRGYYQIYSTVVVAAAAAAVPPLPTFGDMLHPGRRELHPHNLHFLLHRLTVHLLALLPAPQFFLLLFLLHVLQLQHLHRLFCLRNFGPVKHFRV